MTKRMVSTGIVFTLCLLLIACEADERNSAPGPVETPTGSSSTALESDERPPPKCRDRDATEVSIDGDDETDFVFHAFALSHAVLGACTGAGAFDMVPGIGTAEVLMIADVQGDGKDEILFGSTSLLMERVEFAVWQNDGLRVVSLPDGDPLQVHHGPAFPEEQPFTFYRTNCERTRLPYLQGDVVEVTTVRSGQTFRWKATEYSVRGARASITGEPAGEADVEDRAISDFGDQLFARCDPSDR